MEKSNNSYPSISGFQYVFLFLYQYLNLNHKGSIDKKDLEITNIS
jgi:hypothetical protein